MEKGTNEEESRRTKTKGHVKTAGGRVMYMNIIVNPKAFVVTSIMI